METLVPPVSGIVNNAVFQSSAQINQMLHQINHILNVCLVASLVNYAQNFQSVGLIRAGLFGSHNSGSS